MMDDILKSIPNKNIFSSGGKVRVHSEMVTSILVTLPKSHIDPLADTSLTIEADKILMKPMTPSAAHILSGGDRLDLSISISGGKETTNVDEIVQRNL
jgi:hypothetical protein